MLSTGASYSDSFSIVTRSAWIATFSVDTGEARQDCTNPLPDFVVNATISFSTSPRKLVEDGKRSRPPVAYANFEDASTDLEDASDCCVSASLVPGDYRHEQF
jgi:hypothetical protein